MSYEKDFRDQEPWKSILRQIKDHDPLGSKWEPFADFNPDGDMFEWLNERVSYNGERVNDFITIYRAQDDDRIVGGCIKNVAHLMDPENKPKTSRMD